MSSSFSLAESAAASGRYVVLFHGGGGVASFLPAGRGDHFDWMFEADAGLRTWATEERLPLREAGSAVALELPLHRLAYLDYEGPVSGNRGSVRRVERGRFRVLSDAADRFEIEVEGDRVGRLLLSRDHLPERSLWRIEFRPQIKGDGTLADAS